MTDDPTLNAKYRPVSPRLRKTIEDALKAEFPELGEGNVGQSASGGGNYSRVPLIATTHAKGPDLMRVNITVSNEFAPKRILPDDFNEENPNR